MSDLPPTHMGGVGRSSILPLWRPSDGLLGRLNLIESAERSLDVQYYLWAPDTIGYLMLDRLLAAADRGVQVRMIVDDLKLRSRTRSIASLCLHPNLEIRLFNPWRKRRNAVTEGLEFAHRFRKLDQRMHNKLLVADTERAVFGGRNIADEHFGLGDQFNLVDFDVLLVGTQAADLSRVFETYWESPASVSGATLVDSVTEVDLSETRSDLAGEYEDHASALSGVLDVQGQWNEQARATSREISDDALSVISDAPSLAVGSQPTQVIEALHRSVDSVTHDLLAVTPFFVPNEMDIDWYRQIVERGVRFRILTNSLASNAGTISNSGLNKHRRALLDAGVELHELRTDAAVKPSWDMPPNTSRYLGLHTKLYIIDGERVFLGSVNLDPRSKFINTEVGALVRDAELAAETADVYSELLTPANSWRVEIGSDDDLLWRSDSGTLHRQPSRNRRQSVADRLFGLLPIERYI